MFLICQFSYAFEDYSVKNIIITTQFLQDISISSCTRSKYKKTVNWSEPNKIFEIDSNFSKY